MHARPHDLYRFYDSSDQLLYVGISLSDIGRANKHRQNQPWWSDVSRMDVENLGVVTRPQAEDIERYVIRSERPRHNVVHALRPPRSSPQPSDRLVWLCEICGDPIGDGDGYLDLPKREERRYEAEMRDHLESFPPPPPGKRLTVVSAREIIARPGPPHWSAIHHGCDPDPDAMSYWFDVARIRTHQDVVQWTCHLMNKNWVSITDWIQLTGMTLSGRPIDTSKLVRKKS